MRRDAVRFQQVKGRHGGEKNHFKIRLVHLHPFRQGKHSREVAKSNAVGGEHDHTVAFAQRSTRSIGAQTLRLGLYTDQLKANGEHHKWKRDDEKRSSPWSTNSVGYVKAQSKGWGVS